MPKKEHLEKLQVEAHRLIGKNWSNASLTREKLLGNIDRICEFVAEKGMQHIKHIDGSFVTEFFERQQEKGLVPSTIAGYGTAMRAIASGIGKQNIVPRENANLGGSRKGTRLNPSTPDVPKMLEVREKLYQKAEWLGIASDIRTVFGVRPKESLMSKTTFTDKVGRTLYEIEGAKTGRPRNLTVDSVEKAAVVAQIREYMVKTGHKSIMPSSLTLKQACKFQSNTLNRIGATKANNANAYQWRHAYAQALDIAGVNRALIASDLGHGRIEVLSHYIHRK